MVVILKGKRKHPPAPSPGGDVQVRTVAGFHVLIAVHGEELQAGLFLNRGQAPPLISCLTLTLDIDLPRPSLNP